MMSSRSAKDTVLWTIISMVTLSWVTGMFSISAIDRHDPVTVALFLLYLPIYFFAMVLNARRILRKIP
jgi:hypothetical protein